MKSLPVFTLRIKADFTCNREVGCFIFPAWLNWRYVKFCSSFSPFTCRFVFSLCPSDFYIWTAWFAGAWWMCLHLPVKRRVPITHPSPLIAQSAFGSPQITPECTSSRIQLNCLNRHGALAWVCSDELCHNGEFYPRPRALPPSQCCSGSELLVSDEGYVEPAAGSGQKATMSQGWKFFWDLETDGVQIKGLLWNLQKAILWWTFTDSRNKQHKSKCPVLKEFKIFFSVIQRTTLHLFALSRQTGQSKVEKMWQWRLGRFLDFNLNFRAAREAFSQDLGLCAS